MLRLCWRQSIDLFIRPTHAENSFDILNSLPGKLGLVSYAARSICICDTYSSPPNELQVRTHLTSLYCSEWLEAGARPGQKCAKHLRPKQTLRRATKRMTKKASRATVLAGSIRYVWVSYTAPSMKYFASWGMANARLFGSSETESESQLSFKPLT